MNLKPLKIEAKFLDEYKRSRLDQYNRRSPKQKRYFKKPITAPSCQGCNKDLVQGDLVFEFRTKTYTHTSLDCVRSINKYVMTKELKQLL